MQVVEDGLRFSLLLNLTLLIVIGFFQCPCNLVLPFPIAWTSLANAVLNSKDGTNGDELRGKSRSLPLRPLFCEASSSCWVPPRLAASTGRLPSPSRMPAAWPTATYFSLLLWFSVVERLSPRVVRPRVLGPGEPPHVERAASYPAQDRTVREHAPTSDHEL